MKKSLVIGTVTIPFLLMGNFACTGAGDGNGTSDADTDSDSDADADTDTDTNTDTDTDTDSQQQWCDGPSGLCWQNPAEDLELNWFQAAGESDETSNLDGGVDYCGDLDWAGETDWRLPLIQELIDLIRGCVNGIATGDLSPSGCGVTDPDCLDYTCKEEDPACAACEPGGGPDQSPANCYWEPALGGPCEAYWSASSYTHDPDYAWLVGYYGGVVIDGARTDEFPVRCVRVNDAPN